MSSPDSECDKSTGFTFLSYIAPNSYAIPNMLNKSPRFAVSSKSITPSSICKYLAGSSPTTASSPSSHIPSLSACVRNFPSIPSSASEHIIPLDSCPRIIPLFIVTSSGSSAPTFATITFSPALTFGAPHTMFSTSVPMFTVHICRWSESG